MPLIILNGILQWFKENLWLIYLVLVIISIPVKLPLAFIYLILYSILEHFNYSKINDLESPETFINI